MWVKRIVKNGKTSKIDNSFSGSRKFSKIAKTIDDRIKVLPEMEKLPKWEKLSALNQNG